MGYEVKLYVGEVHKGVLTEQGREYFLRVAETDLCKPGYDSGVIYLHKKLQGVPIYMYDDLEGNTRWTEDHYGDELFAYDAEEVLNILKKDEKKYPYRRFRLAIAMIKQALKDWNDDEKLMIAYFGY